MAIGTGFHDHARTILAAILAVSGNKGLPSKVNVKNLQHDFLTSKADGFVCTVESVPFHVLDATTDGQPGYQIGRETATTVVVASASNDSSF